MQSVRTDSSAESAKAEPSAAVLLRDDDDLEAVGHWQGDDRDEARESAGKPIGAPLGSRGVRAPEPTAPWWSGSPQLASRCRSRPRAPGEQRGRGRRHWRTPVASGRRLIGSDCTEVEDQLSKLPSSPMARRWWGVTFRTGHDERGGPTRGRPRQPDTRRQTDPVFDMTRPAAPVRRLNPGTCRRSSSIGSRVARRGRGYTLFDRRAGGESSW